MNNVTPDMIAEAVASATPTFGTATAAKRGRRPEWPYVPVIKLYEATEKVGTGKAQTTQIKGKAFATREEAVAYAQRRIDHQLALLAEKLADPAYRALREEHGLPREVTA